MPGDTIVDTAASANHTADIALEDPGQRQGGTVPCCS